MRRFAFPPLLLLMLILAGCKVGQSADSNSAATSVKTPYSSDTPTEDCYLCGGGIENLIPSYWGQNNIALISLNTLSNQQPCLNQVQFLRGVFHCAPIFYTQFAENIADMGFYRGEFDAQNLPDLCIAFVVAQQP